ncbi:hypothetical protein HU200_043884 [Digitaria exilis]|uniref:Uncharacterized protein n=1 Tax=Digitaria exilis TaxID=1010633 RepID=A0A835B5F5_9POAL|nr:hypothetical protein HU200_043884 [Digitaria exilis]
MVVEMELDSDVDAVLRRFDLRLDGGRGSGEPCRRDRSRSGGDGAAEGKEGSDGGGGIYKEAAAVAGDGSGSGDGGALVQVWAPARDGVRRRVLTTRGQPFVLAPPQCHRLFQYRTVSLTHAFPVGGAGVPGERGLPGRVFDAGVPECTPNVQFYGTGEYARISYALIYDIQGALAIPILDPVDGDCVAVVELVTTEPKLCFAAEVDKLSKALQAVALRGSEICWHVPEVCNDDEADDQAMFEVSEILTAVGEAHELPLAQAWVRCKRCSSNTSAEQQQHASLTSAGTPFYLAGGDQSLLAGFHEACVEHHLRRPGRGGLVEEAAAARGPRFCADVAKYSMDAYPLAHHARFCGLAGCLAVGVQRRRGDGDGDGGASMEECVLEFFLPLDCREGAAQKKAAEAVAATIMERFGDGHLKAIVISGLQDLAFEIVADGECMIRPDRVTIADDHELELNDHCGDERDSDEEGLHLAEVMGTVDVEAPNMNNGDQNGGEEPIPEVGEKKKKAKRKGEKTVSLEVLQSFFSGSLKDAARSLGVCPTTMKRICRQHGISRWPFRKIAKANRSLDKIKRVFESVPGSSNPMAPSTPAAAASQQAPAVATAHRDHALPCLSSALGMASSQGSCHAPPKDAAVRVPLHGVDATGVVTVKASYRGDIIRFRVACSAGVATVKGEVAKRLGLDAGEFDVKYLDDDNEWVLLSCDADFQECLDVVPAMSGASTASGSGAAQPVVRLMVQEVAEIHGSSCGSSD